MTQLELNSYCSNKTHMWIIKQRQAKMTNFLRFVDNPGTFRGCFGEDGGVVNSLFEN
jgi:hypothetical protein